MDEKAHDLTTLLRELESKEAEIKRLKCLLKGDTKGPRESNEELVGPYPSILQKSRDGPTVKVKDSLDNPEIARYSRQLILPELGVKGQVALCNSSVLIVGAGGLGCPAAIYLAAAGIGKIGIVDYDEVELSNLHRQILHTEGRVGVKKSVSAAFACQQLNEAVTCVPYHLALDSTNAIEIIQEYDIVLDATDNVATRYLLNDACILCGKTLVSGSALRFEGQLTVYNYKGGPCYRCLYPNPPPPETVTNCSDGGVLGVVPGIIGCIQALEAIKIAAGIEPAYSQKLLLFDALDGTFRPIKLRPRQKGCKVCGDSPTITKLIDYEQFCGAAATDKSKSVHVLSDEDRISVQEYKAVSDRREPHILVDVRQPVEMEICKLVNTTNIPIDQIEKEKTLAILSEKISSADCEVPLPVFVVCRRGNDSQMAVHKLRKLLGDLPVTIKDIGGGLTAWAKHIDPSFPVY